MNANIWTRHTVTINGVRVHFQFNSKTNVVLVPRGCGLAFYAENSKAAASVLRERLSA